MTDAKVEHAENHDDRARLPRWSRILLVLFAVVVVFGLALHAYAMATAPEPSTGAEQTPPPVMGFAPADDQTAADDGDEATAPDGAASWAPTVMRMGFSFFVGFTIAFALRAFAKLAMIFAGIFFLLLFGLQYAELITVNWERMEGIYDGLMPWLREQTASLAAFIQGYLPSAGTGGLGLAAGFYRVR